MKKKPFGLFPIFFGINSVNYRSEGIRPGGRGGLDQIKKPRDNGRIEREREESAGRVAGSPRREIDGAKRRNKKKPEKKLKSKKLKNKK